MYPRRKIGHKPSGEAIEKHLTLKAIWFLKMNLINLLPRFAILQNRFVEAHGVNISDA